MRVHTCLHLLSALLPYPVTGGQVGDGRGRLDFDIPEAILDKATLTERLNALIAAGAAVTPGVDHRRGARRPARPRQDHGRGAADRRRQRPPHPHRRP